MVQYKKIMFDSNIICIAYLCSQKTVCLMFGRRHMNRSHQTDASISFPKHTTKFHHPDDYDVTKKVQEDED